MNEDAFEHDRATCSAVPLGKGFGFVASEAGTEYFFHQSACNGVQFDELREGQAVAFDEGDGPKGPRAENVTLA